MTKRLNESEKNRIMNKIHEQEYEESLREIVLSESYLPMEVIHKDPSLVPSFDPQKRISRLETLRKEYHLLVGQKFGGDHSQTLDKRIERVGREMDKEIERIDPSILKQNHYLREICLKEEQRYRVIVKIEKEVAKLLKRAEEYEKDGKRKKVEEMYIKAIEKDVSIVCEGEFPPVPLKPIKGSVDDVIKAIKEGKTPK